MKKEKGKTVIELNQYHLNDQKSRDIFQKFFTEAENLKTIIYKSNQKSDQTVLKIRDEVQKSTQKSTQEIAHVVSSFESAIKKQ
ncbi:MAG: hypothetical protein GY730_05710 [bacterium]|nr:hypothetical protein [bacterium]